MFKHAIVSVTSFALSAMALLFVSSTERCRIHYDGQITVSMNVQVSMGLSQVKHFEVILAADPANAQHLIAASMKLPVPEDYNRTEVAVYRSTNGGKTWELTLERKRVRENESIGDPTLAYGTDGTIYLALFGKNFFKSNSCQYDILRTTDQGKTWQDAATFNHDVDRPFLMVDRTSGSHHGSIYCLSTVNGKPGAVISSDGGKNFNAPVPLSGEDRPYGLGGGTVLSDGSLAFCYVIPKDRAIEKTGTAALIFRRSVDGGKTLLPSKTVSAVSWLEDIGMPILTADTGNGAYRDRLYLVWPDAVSSGTRVMFASSTDKGASWSKPIVLSEQPTGDGKDAPYRGFLPTVAVNRAGEVGVSWYDGREIPDGQEGWNLRFRASRDGGNTWLPSVRVSEKASLFPKNERPENLFAGDTAGLAADAEGVFHALWIDNRTGIRQVWTATVNVEEPLSR